MIDENEKKTSLKPSKGEIKSSDVVQNFIFEERNFSFNSLQKERGRFRENEREETDNRAARADDANCETS